MDVLFDFQMQKTSTFGAFWVKNSINIPQTCCKTISTSQEHLGPRLSMIKQSCFMII